ncbi:MAG: hypothetical protein L3J89_12495 [Gammaproteobacteria bacterium]|nr:hypothetical protein [Gammaproteobacteria bacterium]
MMLRLPHKIFFIMFIMFAFGGIANAHQKPQKEFVHGITIKLGHHSYYFAGAPDGKNGATDVPGHQWVRIGKHHLIGKHYNTGPFGAPDWWSSDAGDGELLYIMDAIIDKWSEIKAAHYVTKGYNHYHMLVDTETGELHPNKVVWFKHVAVKSFMFDGEGPLDFLGIEAYQVVPGVDYNVGPNWHIPYNPNPE